MTREEAYKLVTDWTENKNLVKHMLAVEAQMRALAKHFGENEDDWGLAGLVHDADYEKWPKEHPKKLLEELKKRKVPDWLYFAVEAHAWNYNGMEVEPRTQLEWALYTCDELSGFIIACALVRPDKNLVSVTVESILKKWRQKAFAAGVHREHIELCEEKLGIKLEDYIKICLKALQEISGELGL
jgi:predicted hydrolase (HD superfamily)